MSQGGPPREADAGSAEERDAVVGFLLGLRADRVRDFLGRQGLARYGDRGELRVRIDGALDGGRITLIDILDFLDAVEPWGKQHVLLFEGGDRLVESWRDPSRVRPRLEAAGVGDLVDARLPVGVPEQLTLSSIRLDHGRIISVTAVERRSERERDPSRDRVEMDDRGRRVDLVAYVRTVARGLLTFRWDLRTNTAALHITQGNRGYDYIGAHGRFRDLVRPFLDLDRFRAADLRPVVGRLHALERDGRPEARSHRLGYRSRGGRIIEASSPSYHDSVTGEANIDDALTAIGDASSGRIGNFYWLASGDGGAGRNPLSSDLHVVVVAGENRVNFMVPSSEEAIAYVLQRIRALVGRPS